MCEGCQVGLQKEQVTFCSQVAEEHHKGTINVSVYRIKESPVWGSEVEVRAFEAGH